MAVASPCPAGGTSRTDWPFAACVPRVCVRGRPFKGVRRREAAHAEDTLSARFKTRPREASQRVKTRPREVRLRRRRVLVSTRRCEAYGEKHLQTVKAITMIALLERKLGREEKGIEWYRKELRIRE